MKQIKGKNYFVSVGYLDKEKAKDGVHAKDIESIFVKCKKGTALYFDDSDKENIVSLPLVPVNQIQRKKDKFIFRVRVDAFDMDFEMTELRKNANIIGLFSECKKDAIQTIKHISFFETDTSFWSTGGTVTFSIEVPVDKILGE